MKYILAINPGSTSTKIAIFENGKELFTKTLRHSSEELAPYPAVIDQYDFRKEAILVALKEHQIEVSDLAAVVGRGGLLRPIPSGVYEVNETMIADLRSAQYGEHASNLGGIIANALAKEAGCKAYIADPVVVDELEDVARISGHPKFPRISIFHALNQKAIAKQFAREQGKAYEDLNLIVVHMGGGVSVGTHKAGLVIDVNNALNGEGPFSPERSGTLPAYALAQACFSGEYTLPEIKAMIAGKGGLVAHLGTNSFLEIEKREEAGDPEAIFFTEAYVYNVAKYIGAASTVLCGKVDAILITGGIAYGKKLCESIKERVGFIAPVYVYPGEDEMAALAGNAQAVLDGTEAPKNY